MPYGGSALSFALLRIAVFGSMASLDLIADAGTRDALLLPRPLQASVPGAPWLRAFATLPTRITLPLLLLFRFAAVTAAIGFGTALSTTLAVALGTVFLGVPSLYGGVRAFQHLWWFGAILSTTPCGASLSVDSFVFGVSGARYPWHTAATIILAILGLVYFFPGLWKLREGGMYWGDTLPGTINSLWTGTRSIPYWISSLFDQRAFWRLVGLLVIVYELSFPALMFLVPTTAAILALSFHAANAVIVRIPFLHLAICYVFFIPFGPRDLQISRLIIISERPLDQAQVLAVGVIILLGIVLTGVSGKRWWPFGIYPTFATAPSDSFLSVRFEIDASGRSCSVDLARLFAERFGGRRGLTLLAALASKADRSPCILNELCYIAHREILHRGIHVVGTWRLIRETRTRGVPSTILSEDVLCSGHGGLHGAHSA